MGRHKLETINGYTIRYVDELGIVALVDPHQKKIWIHEAFKNEKFKQKILAHELKHTTGNDIWHDVKDLLNPIGGFTTWKIIYQQKGVKYLAQWVLAQLKWSSPFFRFQGQNIKNESAWALWFTTLIFGLAYAIFTHDLSIEWLGLFGLLMVWAANTK